MARATKAAPRRPRVALTREQVVDAALRVLSTDGFAALSMRRVAQELGVGTMSLYWHVADRDELLDAVFERTVSMQLLSEVPADWRGALRAIAHASRRMHEQASWMLDIGLRPALGAGILEHVEQSLAATESMHAPTAFRLAALRAVDAYVLGWVLELKVQDAAAVPELTADATAALEGGRFPRYAALMAELDAHGEWQQAQQFETGLEMLLDGIAAGIAALA